MTVMLQLPKELGRRIKRAAQQKRVNMRQYILTTLMDAISYDEALGLMQAELAQASPLSVDEILSQIPARPPMPGDELPVR